MRELFWLPDEAWAELDPHLSKNWRDKPRVFEGAARHSSFARAVGELDVIEAVGSYPVKVFEDRVGSPPFPPTERRPAI